MSYTIYPKIKYQYDCQSIVVYNDIYNDRATAETGDLTALSFRLRRYDESEYLTEAISVSTPATTTEWGTISITDLISYRYYPTVSASSPGASSVYTLTITFTDASTLVPTFTSSSSTWAQVFGGLVTSLATLGSGTATGSYDTSLNSLFIANGTKTISTIVITADNSDTSIETPTLTSTSSFDQDVYSIEVDITVDAADTSRVYYRPIYCSIYQCILRLFGRIPELESCNSCNDDCIRYIKTAGALMTSLKYKEILNAEDIADAQEIISRLEDICNNEDCQCYD